MTSRRVEVSFPSGDETLVGDLVLPDGDGPFPALVTVAGTGPQNRYGDQVLPDGTVSPHPRHRWVGDRLADAGIAQLCWDKRGVQASSGGDRSHGDPPGDRDAHASVETDVADVKAAIEFLATRSEVNAERIVVMGTSAGAYFTCLVSSETDIPSGYILWGALYMGILDFADWIYGNIVEYADRGDEEKEWVEANAKEFYELALEWPRVLESVHAGRPVHEWVKDGVTRQHFLARTHQEVALQYPKQFARIQKPVMVIHGNKDYNVPVTEAFKSSRALRDGGNTDVTLTIVPDADHGMHLVPGFETDRELMEYRFGGFLHAPYSEYFIHSVIGWIKDLDVRLDRSS